VLLDAVQELPVAEHERALYYGFGLVACRLAQELGDQGRRQTFIRAAVDAVKRRHDRQSDQLEADPAEGLRCESLLNLDANAAVIGLGYVVAKRYQSAPIAERLTTSSLFVGRTEKARQVAPQTRVYPRQAQLEQVLTGNGALDRVMSCTFGGASNLLLQSLMMRYGKDSLPVIAGVPIADLFSVDEIPTLVSDKTARIAARMRADQIHDLGSYATADETGAITLANIPRPAGPIPPQKDLLHPLLHEETLECPVLQIKPAYVGNIPGEAYLVPLASRMLAEIIVTAQQEIMH
jgi:hypothetical protein